jgi:hypothetical protein
LPGQQLGSSVAVIRYAKQPQITVPHQGTVPPQAHNAPVSGAKQIPTLRQAEGKKAVILLRLAEY